MINYTPPKKPFSFYVILFTVSIIVFRIIIRTMSYFFNFPSNTLIYLFLQMTIFVSIVLISSVLLDIVYNFRNNSKLKE
jgi:magnesium-transporting ATPase (P-type)